MERPDDTPLEITCLASRQVYRNRWMTVREDTIMRPGGATGLYGVVEKADFAVIAPIENGSVYLVEQYRYPVQGRYWELPQGAWETQPDVDPAELAAAELHEETGLIAAQLIDAGHLFLAYGFCDQAYRVYLATGLQQHGARLDAEEEGLIARAFPLPEVERMIADGQIKDATTVAALGLLRIKGLIQ